MMALMQMWLLFHTSAMSWCVIGAAVSFVLLWHLCCGIGASMGFGAAVVLAILWHLDHGPLVLLL